MSAALRTFLVLLTLLGLGGAAAVCDSAMSTQAALGLGEASVELQEAGARRALRADARRTLEQAWSRPLEWHGAAVDALSWIALLDHIDEHGSAQLQESASLGQRAVALTPIAPKTWVRLGLVSNAGADVHVCARGGCVERSWQAVRMAEPEFACARLRAAHEMGLLTSRDDERIDWYLRAKPEWGAIARCLDFLPPELRVRLIIESD